MSIMTLSKFAHHGRQIYELASNWTVMKWHLRGHNGVLGYTLHMIRQTWRKRLFCDEFIFVNFKFFWWLAAQCPLCAQISRVYCLWIQGQCMVIFPTIILFCRLQVCNVISKLLKWFKYGEMKFKKFNPYYWTK